MPPLKSHTPDLFLANKQCEAFLAGIGRAICLRSVSSEGCRRCPKKLIKEDEKEMGELAASLQLLLTD